LPKLLPKFSEPARSYGLFWKQPQTDTLCRNQNMQGSVMKAGGSWKYGGHTSSQMHWATSWPRCSAASAD